MISVNNPDKHLEDEGVWADYRGSSFLLANTDNFKFQKLFSRLQMPHRKRIDKGTIDPETALDIMCEALSKAVLLDWKNVTGDDGENVSYTPELGRRALANNGDLREFIQEYAADIDNFREVDKEEMGKSSQASSSGT